MMLTPRVTLHIMNTGHNPSPTQVLTSDVGLTLSTSLSSLSTSTTPVSIQMMAAACGGQFAALAAQYAPYLPAVLAPWDRLWQAAGAAVII